MKEEILYCFSKVSFAELEVVVLWIINAAQLLGSCASNCDVIPRL